MQLLLLSMGIYSRQYSDLMPTAISEGNAVAQSEYVVFSVDYLRKMVESIWNNMGSITSVSMFVFLFILGIFIVINIVNNFSSRW